MKLLEQTTLVLVEGRAQKIYSIDLCEVGTGQYVVNFRYGVRGLPLRDGSKTTLPVSFDEARRVFDRLVAQQTDRGYRPEGAARVASAPPPAAAAPGANPQRDIILMRLAAAAAGRKYEGREWQIERVIWRAGELRLREAEGSLIALAGTSPGLRDYCIAWALGRLGTAASIPVLQRLYGTANAPGHVRRAATLSLLTLGDAATKNEITRHLYAALPPELQGPAAGTDPEAFRAALEAYLARESGRGFGAVEVAYIIDSPTVRPAVLAQLRIAPLAPPYFYFLRHVFKAAETRRDGEAFGILAYRFEVTRASRSYSNYSYHKTRARPGNESAYHGPTRRYLRHRVMRTLRRAGQANDLEYVNLAVGLLLAYSDRDAPYDRHLAFGYVIYGASNDFLVSAGRTMWAAGTDFDAATTRNEMFPELWERRPEGLMHLLAASQCTPVIRFAARAIRAVPSFLDQLDVDDVITLLGRPYPETSALGLDLAARLYALHHALPLLAALANSNYEPARKQGMAWLDEQRVAVLADSPLLVQLVLSPYADTREFARRLLRSAVLPPDAAAALVARIVAGMLALGAEGDEQARDATRTLVDALGPQLATIGPPVVQDLLAHPLSGVQELGAELLLRTQAGSLEDATLARVLQSEHANVRAVGMRLLAGLPDDVLASFELLLVRLSTDRNADLRNASRPILARLKAGYPSEVETIARGLVEALLRRKLPEGAPSHVLLILKEDLFDRVLSLPTEDVWRLLQSGSAHAQELGGLLLQRFDPSQFSLEQIVQLASHDILSIRQAAWSFVDRSEARVRASMAEASKLLDAKWEDSRAFAFDFFRTRLGAEAYTADVLVTILDSVREDVQAFGRELTQTHFREEDGPVLMTKLSEHPSRAVQLFTTNYLARYATGDAQKLLSMQPYFTGVLSRVNQGRIAKQRVLAFLEREGGASEDAARVVLGLLHRLSATVAVETKGAAIAAMVAIHHAQPGVPLPLKIKEPPVRGRNGIPVLV